MRTKTSIIWTMPIDELTDIVSNSTSIAQILRSLGFKSTTGVGMKRVKQRCNNDNIDISHIPTGVGHNKNRSYYGNKGIPLNTILVVNSTYTNRGSLKKRLIRDELLINVCDICGQNPIWNDKPITLILDHINGVNNDHRLENLRLVCPNCNSQLSTTGSRNWNNKTKTI